MVFQVAVSTREQGVFVVAVKGALDAATYTIFEKELEPFLIATTKAIILDLHGVNYISSLGIGAVFKVTNTIRGFKGTVLMTNLQPQIQKVFDIVKTLPGPIFASIEEADAYLDEIQRKQ